MVRSKEFEAMKAGKSAIGTWLSCQYTKYTLMDGMVWMKYKSPDQLEYVFF